jgi:hypothetical protein
MSLQDRVCQSTTTCKQKHDTLPIVTIKTHFKHLNYPNDVVLEQSRRDSTRLDSTRTSPHDRSHFVSLPLHPISSLPASLRLTAPPRLMPYPAPSFTQPRLDLLASTSSSLPLDLAMPHLPTHLTTVHPENLPSTTHSNLRRQCAMLGSIACASLFICICTGEKRTTRLPPLTLSIG